MTLRLRCIRCGDVADLDPKAVAWFGICDACIAKWYAWRDRGVSYNKRQNVFYRHRIRMTGHPTYRALTAALAAMEAAPHGKMDAPCEGPADCGWHNGGPCGPCKARESVTNVAEETDRA